MEIFSTLIQQLIIMFIYMFIGYVLFKTDKLTEEGTKDLGTLLIWLIMPALIINNFCVAYSTKKLFQLILSTVLALLALILSMLISKLVYKKSPVDSFSSTFSNAGFMGIPLVTATLGADAVFYVTGFLALMNVLQQTYGVKILRANGATQYKVSLKNLLLHPLIISPLIGLVIFCSGLGGHLPTVIGTSIDGIASMTSPLAMLVLGTYLAQTNLIEPFTSIPLYKQSIVRLLLIPFITVLVFYFLPVDNTIKLAVTISASAPVATTTSIYAHQHEQDYTYAGQTIALSTLLSVITLPCVVLIANLIYSL